MENNNIFGLEYSECDSIISNLNSAISQAKTDLEYINYAYLQVSGCRNSAKDAVWNSLEGIKEIINDIDKFKNDFSEYYEAVKEFDEKLSYDIREKSSTFEGICEILTSKEFGYFSTGKDGLAGTAKIAFKSMIGYNNIRGYGVLANLEKTLKTFKLNNFQISEKNGYYIIKGNPGYRKGIPGLEKIKGTRYKIGSEKFIEAGLDRYVTKGSSFKEGLVKFKSNIKPCIKDGFNIKSNTTLKSGIKNFGKSTFIPKNGEGLGNIAKGLGITAITAGVAKTVYDNSQSGADAGKYTGDAVSSAVSGAVGMAAGSAGAEIGFAIGTAIPIPVVGSVVGATLGFAGGYVGGVIANELMNEVDIGGKPVSGWISEKIDYAVDGVVEKGSKLLNSVKGIF